MWDFFRSQKVQVARSYESLNLIRFFYDDGYSLESHEVLEKKEDNNIGLYFENDSNFNGKGIHGYMPEADDADLIGMDSGGALDDDEEGDMDNSDASVAI